MFEEIEDRLIAADVPLEIVDQLIEEMTYAVARKELSDASMLRQMLSHKIAKYVSVTKEDQWLTHTPEILLIVGVNGAGKTTTIGKLAQYFMADGYSVLLGAADTFRAAAVEQLVAWGEKLGWM